MALSTQEKELLRQAMCAGAFSKIVQGQNGQPMRGPVTPAVLVAVQALTDEEVRVILRTYQAQAATQLTTQMANMQTQVAKTQTQLTAIQAVTIAPVPTPTPA